MTNASNDDNMNDTEFFRNSEDSGVSEDSEKKEKYGNGGRIK